MPVGFVQQNVDTSSADSFETRCVKQLRLTSVLRSSILFVDFRVKNTGSSTNDLIFRGLSTSASVILLANKTRSIWSSRDDVVVFIQSFNISNTHIWAVLITMEGYDSE